jgi:uncharacterized protein (TIGR02217 family)
MAPPLTAFFEARRGRLCGFRFRDFADFKSCAPGGSAGAGRSGDAGPATARATTFALSKTYGEGGEAAGAGVIAKPVEPVSVKCGGRRRRTGAVGAFEVDVDRPAW